MDLGPTILDVMRQPTPGHFMGQSLTPYLRGETPQPRPRLTAALALANVRHGNINDTNEPAACVEFQPVQRPDWFPPHPRRPREGTPEPVSPPAGREVVVDFNAQFGWKDLGAGVRSKSLAGDTMKLTVWQLSSGPGVNAEIGRAHV